MSLGIVGFGAGVTGLLVIGQQSAWHWTLVITIAADGGLVVEAAMPARADLAVLRSSTGQWFISRSSDTRTRHDDVRYRRPREIFRSLATRQGRRHLQFEWPDHEDVPVPRDYDGDGRADVAVYKSTRDWFIFGVERRLPRAAALRCVRPWPRTGAGRLRRRRHG